MNTKQIPENNIVTKLMTSTIHTSCGHHSKAIQQKQHTKQNRSIRVGTKKAITDIDKDKLSVHNSQTSLHIAQTKSTAHKP